MPKQNYFSFVLTESDAGHLEALKRINEGQYTVLMHANPVDGKHLSYQQIADQLGIPLNTVKTRLHRARERIARWREKYAEANAQAPVQAEQQASQ